MQGVVNWHIGRCGSSVLGSLLKQNSQIAYSNEIYSQYMPRRRGSKQLPPLPQVVDQAREGLKQPWHCFEVKHLADQNLGLYPGTTHEDWLQTFLERGYRRHLVMTRRNGLRRIVSHLRAARTREYVRTAQVPADGADPEPLVIPLEKISHGFAQRSLLAWLEIYERGHAAMLALLRTVQRQQPDLHCLELVYEDHIERDPCIAYSMVCAQLRIPASPVTVTLRQINPGPLQALISNYDEVCQVLGPTRFAWMLEA